MTRTTRPCLPAILLCGTLLLSCGVTEVEPRPDAGNLPPGGSVPSCTDGQTNGTESDVDCGGACPERCVPGKVCHDDGDCESAVCRAARCQAPTCEDGVKNGTESDADCGGGTGCGPCSVGRGCSVGGDCVSGVCLGGACAAPSCGDGVKNQSETDVDCGGVCSEKPCAMGMGCAEPTDCASGVCMANVCAAATCTDGVRNGGESDVDCGGGDCPGCAAGRTCSGPGSCLSGVCTDGVCQAPSCSDGMMNGTETDTDCGGSCQAKCEAGEGCATPSDCVSRVCTGGVCQAATCTDGVRNGNESDIDCGGTCLQRCGWGQRCGSPADCGMGVTCSNGTCSGCAAGLGNCDKDPANGCETSIGSNLLHCGGCGMACSTANVAQNACTQGSCTGTCAAGYFDCDNNMRANGCEVNGQTDPQNCGGCGISVNDGNACTTDSCVNGVVTHTPIPGCGVQTCAHSACAIGVALNAQACSRPGTNNDCVARVCAEDSYCCSVEWDIICRNTAMDPAICPTGLTSPNTANFTCNCAHSFCSTGGVSQPLMRSCDPCVKRVCELDSYCCSTDWDNVCVSAVAQECNIVCP